MNQKLMPGLKWIHNYLPITGEFRNLWRIRLNLSKFHAIDIYQTYFYFSEEATFNMIYPTFVHLVFFSTYFKRIYQVLKSFHCPNIIANMYFAIIKWNYIFDLWKSIFYWSKKCMNQNTCQNWNYMIFRNQLNIKYNELRIIYLLTSNENSFRIINKEILIANLQVCFCVLFMLQFIQDFLEKKRWVYQYQSWIEVLCM